MARPLPAAGARTTSACVVPEAQFDQLFPSRIAFLADAGHESGGPVHVVKRLAPDGDDLTCRRRPLDKER
ncbi:hypothetical protein ACGFYV_35240 [Streptomyces sp. NPDC048297]|uniref:hypothetical protein n=1 Tax=Streptomyces sp. NPDC048297 TaxID=3365531 RepID=UPI00371366D3